MEFEITLTKVETFKLKPYGKFLLSLARNPREQVPHIIGAANLNIDLDGAMPFTEQQEKDILKLMRKHKTDVFTDGTWNGYYTRGGCARYCSLCRISHPKLTEYSQNEAFKQDVDNR